MRKAISTALDELTMLNAHNEIKFLAYVVVTRDGSRRVMTGKADPLHIAGSLDFMKTKILLQEMREHGWVETETPPAVSAQ